MKKVNKEIKPELTYPHTPDSYRDNTRPEHRRASAPIDWLYGYRQKKSSQIEDSRVAVRHDRGYE